MERATGTEVYGCGSPQTTDITLNIQTTTGSNFSISVNGKNTVEHLKKLVSKKLKVSKDRICLLYRERQLRDGTMEENGLLDGSRVILLPSVETGLLSQRPENSVMQALESLNDTQVNDFLSGKSPLNLTMRLGDHMMLIQLQLSTLNANGSRSMNPPSKNTIFSLHAKGEKDSPSSESTAQKSTDNDSPGKSRGMRRTAFLKRKDYELLQNAFELYKTMREVTMGKRAATKLNDKSTDTSSSSDPSDTSLESEQSPIKSLSNLVSSPIDVSTTEGKDSGLANSVKSNLIDLLSQNKLGNEPTPSTSAVSDKTCPSTSSHTPESSFSDDSDNFTDQSSFLAENTIDEYPLESLFNSAIDHGIFDEDDESMMDREISNLATTSQGTQASSGGLPKRFQYLLHKTSKFKHPIGQNKQKVFMQSVVNKHKKRMQNMQDSNLAQPSTSKAEPYITNSRKLILQPSSSGQADDDAVPSTSKQIPFKAPDAPKKQQKISTTQPIDTKALIEASKNLTQKLKKLSKEVLTNKIDLRAAEQSLRNKIGRGAVIESMKHHGKGIYSGTFSGTLNPALQDRYGRPKRDISTIIHILNDLLCAAPPIALAHKDGKLSCSTGTDESSKCLGCSQPSCSYGQCDGHLPSTSTAGKNCTCNSKDCQCKRLNSETCPTCTGKPTVDMCETCNTAKALAMENSKTKCKLEQLRLVMQQKKQRREARKLKTMPYTTSPAKAMAAEQPAPIPEEIETVA